MKKPRAKKGKGKSKPTQRSLEHLRAQGWECAIVEKWNPHAFIRQDLFGFADLLCMKPGEGFLAVQTTSGTHVQERVAKIQAEPRAITFLKSGGKIQVHGWRYLKATGWTIISLDLGLE